MRVEELIREELSRWAVQELVEDMHECVQWVLG